VRPTEIAQRLATLKGRKILVYEPLETHTMKIFSKEVPKMTPGRAVLVELIARYLGGLIDPFITLLEIHKLFYFMQEAGEPLKLKFEKGHYGPYANNLRYVLSAVERHLISGYEDGGDKPQKQIKLVPGAVKNAKEFLENNETTKKHFERVSTLVEGFESSFGLELLATVHWVGTKSKSDELDTIIEQVYSWNDGKKQFSKRQIEIALNRLIDYNWIVGS